MMLNPAPMDVPLPLGRTHTLRAAIASAFESGEAPLSPLPWAAAGMLHPGGPPPLPWLVNALGSDDELASAVLRLANAPSFQPRRPLLSLAQAGSRLGVQTLGELALAAAVQSAVVLTGFENELRRFWRQSLAAAVFAKDLAGSGGVPAALAFAAGLLHEIGLPIAMAEAVRRCEDLGWAATSRGTYEAVLAAAHATAPLAALSVISLWQVPSAVASAIVTAGPGFRLTDSPQAAVAHMATQMAASLYRGESPWEPDVAALAVNDATAAGLPGRGHSVRVLVDSMTV